MLYICMSAAGSIPLILCSILWLIQNQSYDYRLGKSLLLLSMFFYLAPFQLVKYVLPEWTVPLLKLPMDLHIQQDFYKVVEIKSILTPDDSLWIPKWLSFLLALWFCVITVFAVYHLVKYRINIRRMLAGSEKRTVVVDGKTVEVLVNKNIRTPYTVGFIWQSIIVPEASLGHPCFEMCYRHEEQHRRNHDSLMKLFCVVITCLNWFNPVAILLFVLYSVTAEYICDASAVKGCTEEEKKSYAKLLAGLSSKDKPLSVVWRNNLSGSEKLMRRRISYMMKRKGFMKRGIAVLIAVMAVIASASTILAYEPFVSIDGDGVVVSDGGEFGNFSISDSFIDVNEYDFSTTDAIFIYEDGTIVPVTDDALPYAICNHTMVSGYYSVHKSNGSGGCTVYVYNAQRCSKCGYIDVGSLNKTVTYPVCPH